MDHGRFTVSLVVLVSLLLGSAAAAKADYGVTSSVPLSDPLQAKIEQRLIGTWRTVIRGETYYFHLGAGNLLGKLDWMEVALVKTGKKKPAFYMRHFVGFPTIIDGEIYFNIGYSSKLIPQLRGATPKQVVASIDRYDIFQLKLSGLGLADLAEFQDLPDKLFGPPCRG